MPLLADTTALEAKRKKLLSEQRDVEKQLRRCIEENAWSAQNQEEYERRYNELADRIISFGEEIAAIDDENLKCTTRKEKIRRFLLELQQSGDIVTEFDETLWNATVEHLIVRSAKEAVVVFRDGTKISVEIPES